MALNTVSSDRLSTNVKNTNFTSAEKQDLTNDILPLAGQLGNRNLIINGQFDIWQRGTDSGSNTTDGILGADRWMLASSGATKQVTRQAFAVGQTDVPSNPKYYLRYAVTTGNNNAALRQRIEGVDRVQGTVTLSFWAKGTNPGGGSFNITNRQDFGTGGSSSSVVDTGVGDFTVTASWAKKTFTFTPPSISGKTLGTNNNDYYELEVFRQPAGDTSTAAYTIDIANVQLEVGSVATDFEHRSFGQELALCKRYYQQYPESTGDGYGVIFNGYVPNSTTVQGGFFFPEMRSSPTISNSGNFRILHQSSAFTVSSFNYYHSQKTSLNPQAITSSSLTVGQGAMVGADNDSTARIKLSAEL